MNGKETRNAGAYDIIHEMHIGDLEIVVGEIPIPTDEPKYMCAFCRKNELFVLYDDVLASDDYPEIIAIYGERVHQQAEKTRVDLIKPKIQGIDNRPLTSEDCIPVYFGDDLNNKVVVIDPNVLRREYRSATQQLHLCTGGFGASGESRGNTCFCVELYSGERTRFDRSDIMGWLKRDQIPKWAEQGLIEYEQAQKKKKRDQSR